MVYDCVMFNDELDILELRLAYMYDHVDHFVIGESPLTYSKQKKSLNFKENIGRFSRFQDKILYIEVPPVPQKDSWDGEFYQRNYLKNALLHCKSDDIIIIADIDELVNLEFIKKNMPITAPSLIDMPLYYYFLNLKTSIQWQKTLISPYKFLKDFDIGDRGRYSDLNPVIMKSSGVPLGWHFSYMFGYDQSLYVSKLKSFSHQEYNTAYYLNPKRILACLSLGVDFLERNSVYKTVELAREVSPQLYDALNETGLKDKLLYQKPGISFYLDFYNLKYYIKFSVKPKLKSWLDEWLFKS